MQALAGRASHFAIADPFEPAIIFDVRPINDVVLVSISARKSDSDSFHAPTFADSASDLPRIPPTLPANVFNMRVVLYAVKIYDDSFHAPVLANRAGNLTISDGLHPTVILDAHLISYVRGRNILREKHYRRQKERRKNFSEHVNHLRRNDNNRAEFLQIKNP